MRDHQIQEKRLLRQLCYLAAAGLAFMGLFVIICYPIYNTNDDLTINRLVDGARGIQTAHVLYQHIFLGYLYTFLYRFFPIVPWYSCLQYAVIYVSLAAIGYVIFERFERFTGIVLYVLVQLVIGHDLYVRMQYTKLAGLASAAGMLLLLQGFADRNEKPRRGLLIGGTILLGIAYMYRDVQALPGIALMGAVWLWVWLTNGNGFTRGLIKSVRLLLPAALLIAVLLVTNKAAYSTSPWKEYRAFDNARIELLDYELPDFEENKEALEELGIDKSAYDMLDGWNYADPEVFTTETLQAMGAMKQKQVLVSKEKISGFLEEVPEGLAHRHMAVLVLAFLLMWLFMSRHTWKDILCLLLELLCFIALYYYLYARGRYLVERVDAPLLLILGLAIMFLCIPRHNAKDNTEVKRQGMSLRMAWLRGAVTLVVCIGSLIFGVTMDTGKSKMLWRHSDYVVEHRNRVIRNRRKLDYVNADTEHFYLARLNTISEDDAFEAFQTAPKGISSNILWTGGWSTFSGYYLKAMEMHGITNPMREGIDREDIRVVDSKIDLLVEYLQNHTESAVRAVRVDIGEAGSDEGTYAGYYLTTAPETE